MTAIRGMIRRVLILTTMTACVWAPTAASAPAVTLDRYTVDSGGGTMTGGGFTVDGTIGQFDAGTMTGGGYKLTGGFWFEQPPGDCDGDGDVDLTDFVHFEQCFTGPGVAMQTDCACVDLDRDGEVTLSDFVAFANGFTGP